MKIRTFWLDENGTSHGCVLHPEHIDIDRWNVYINYGKVNEYSDSFTMLFRWSELPESMNFESFNFDVNEEMVTY